MLEQLTVQYLLIFIDIYKGRNILYDDNNKNINRNINYNIPRDIDI